MCELAIDAVLTVTCLAVLVAELALILRFVAAARLALQSVEMEVRE